MEEGHCVVKKKTNCSVPIPIVVEKVVFCAFCFLSLKKDGYSNCFPFALREINNKTKICKRRC